MNVIASGVFLGIVMAACVIWGMSKFHKHDEGAPWLAYAAFLLPIAFFVLSMVAIEELPPQFDALASLP